LKKINKIIQLIKKQIIEIETIKQNNNENFNIFSILRMERKEVETHSAFIYELLNPYGSHNQKDLFLKLFIYNVLNIKDYGKIIKVTREDPTISNRRIDFVIETTKELIGIEMKIDACDQYEQLHSYKKELEFRQNKNQNINLYYLTLFGNYASNESSKTLQANQDYKIISFYDSIYEWLTLCIKDTNKLTTLKEAIVQYRNLINILTKKENNKMESFMNNIVKGISEIKAIDTIAENYPLIWAKKEIEFWQTIVCNLENKIAEEYSINYLSEYYENDELSYKQLNSIRTKAGKIRQPFGIYLEKDIDNKNYYISISILYGQSNYKDIKIDFNIYHQLSHHEKTNKIIRELQNKIITTINTKVNFYHSIDNDNLTFELFEEEYFNNITQELTNEIINYINLLEKNFNDTEEAIC